jgi:hypothetical protein
VSDPADMGRAHQGAVVLLGIIGAGYTPPVAATYPPRRFAIGSLHAFGSHRRTR